MGRGTNCTLDFMQAELRLFVPGALKHDLQMILTDGRDRSAKTQGYLPETFGHLIGPERYLST